MYAAIEGVKREMEEGRVPLAPPAGDGPDSTIRWKDHTAYLALTASRFSQTLSQESLTSKLGVSFKVETWKFTKNLSLQWKQTFYLPV